MEVINSIPGELKKIYPFQSKFLQIETTIGNLKMHYIEEGSIEKPTILFIHGNPTWSALFRNLVLGLKNDYHVLAIDHIGCGLSDKPEDYSYQLKDHIENLQFFISQKSLTKFHLVLHDWGGAIGSGVATKSPEKILSITYMNTAAFRSNSIPWTIDLLRKQSWGEWFIRKFNGFAYPATFMAMNSKMPSLTKKLYLLPYNNYENRIATAKFVKDIPLNSSHPSYETLKNIEENLIKISCPINLIWGEKDFCFTTEFRDKFQTFFPNAKVHNIPDAGHYVTEDSPEECLAVLKEFLDSINGHINNHQQENPKS